MADINELIEQGKQLISESNLKDAESVLKKALESEPKDPYASFELGKIFFLKSDYDKAIEYYSNACRNKTDFMIPHLEMGKIYLTQRRLDKAEQEFKTVIEKSGPEEKDFKMESLHELGKIYRLYTAERKKSDLEMVLRALSETAVISDENINYNLELGKLYRSLGKSDLSSEVFRQMLDLKKVSKDVFLNNKVLNELEISERKEILISKVRSMIAMILDRCNIRCMICDIWKSKWQARKETMEEIVGLFPYMEDINWEGGEVFMMPGFEDILKEASKYKNLRQIIYTNGLMINEKYLQLIDAGKADVVFSIDGVSESTYEKIRFGGKFVKLKNVLNLVKEYRSNNGKNFKIYLNPVIMKSNCHEIIDFVEFANDFDFDVLTFNPLRGRFGEENIFEINDEKSLANIRKSMPIAIKKAEEYGIRLNDWLPVEYDINDSNDEPGQKEENRCEKNENCAPAINKDNGLIEIDDMICYAPWQRMVLDSAGQIRPHVFCMNEWVGDSEKQSLAEIWNGEGMKNYRRKIAARDFNDICQPECISGKVRENTQDIV